MTERTKRLFLWPLIIASLIPLVFIIKLPRQMNVSMIDLYIASLTGYVGLMLLLWMYILGAKSVMGLVFKDLAPVIKVHKDLGKYGSLAFLLHPIFAVYGYFSPSLKSLIYIVYPDVSTLTARHIALGQIAFFFIAMIWFTSIFLRKRLGFRAWKYLHYFAYISLPFAILHVPDLGPQYMTNPFAKLYFVGVAGAFGVVSLFRLSGFLNLDRTRYIIASHTAVTDVDNMLILQPASDQWLKPRPGQFVYVKQGFISEDHPFSASYFNPETGEITIMYRLHGSFTDFLASLTRGQEVSLMGPYGTFTNDVPEDTDQPIVYLAGGIGITPFVQRILDGGTNENDLLIIANRTHASAPLVNTLRKTLGNRLIALYSREAPAVGEESGRISEQLLRKYISAPQVPIYYVCGSEPFVEECKRILKGMGVANKHIRQEEFSW